MNFQEMRKIPHLSASSIGSFIECGLAYRFSKIDKLESETTGAALTFGSVIHEVLAHYYQGILEGYTISLTEMLDLFEVYWEELAKNNDKIEYSKSKTYEDLRIEGKKLLSVYYQNIDQDLGSILSIEEPFLMDVEGLDIPILGVFDLVTLKDNVVTIIDHKTSGKAYSHIDLRSNLQMSIYHYVATQMYPGYDIKMKFDVLIKTTKPKFERYTVARNHIDNIKIKNTILKVWDGIKKCVFVANTTSWKCSFCQFKKACDAELSEAA